MKFLTLKYQLLFNLRGAFLCKPIGLHNAENLLNYIFCKFIAKIGKRPEN